MTFAHARRRTFTRALLATGALAAATNRPVRPHHAPHWPAAHHSTPNTSIRLPGMRPEKP